ncbi:unnamed protein product [Phaedon cochleariae]|uniref:HDAg domain-containing protein n=1 Tax=Phaedon cochleariae TaxID=80249 RepID=A0A9N9SDZ8_PHACE|nr:unnamed protein product [Phaedon cochleariae]
MANVRDSDTSLWLHNKLGISNDSWTGGSICSQLNAEVLRNIKDCFPDLQTQVKLKLLLSFFHIPRRNLEEWKTELEQILEVALSDSELWVAMLADALKTYPSTGSLNTEISEVDEVRPIFSDLVTDLRKLVRKQNEHNMLPMECHYLNKGALVSVVGNRPEPLKHFTIKKKPKSALLRADLMQKSSDAASNLNKKSCAPVIPVRSRGMPRKMTDTTPLKGIPSRVPSSGFRSGILNSNANNRPPISRVPAGRKEGGVKLLDIADQPLGYAAAKKRKKMQEMEDAKKATENAVLQSPPPVSATTPDYAAGLNTTPSYAPPTPQPTIAPTAAPAPSALPGPLPASLPAAVVSPPAPAALPPPSLPAAQQVTPPAPVVAAAAPIVVAAARPQQPVAAQAQFAQQGRPVPPLLATTAAGQRAMVAEQPQQQVQQVQQQIISTPVVVTQRPIQQQPQPTVTHIRIQPQPSGNALQRRGLALTREQMLEAQDMFRTANKVTRPEKALILGFMAGSRDNPCPHLGNIVTIKLSEDQENVLQADDTFLTVLVETHFQMNYNNGEWKRIKKYRHVENVVDQITQSAPTAALVGDALLDELQQRRVEEDQEVPARGERGGSDHAKRSDGGLGVTENSRVIVDRDVASRFLVVIGGFKREKFGCQQRFVRMGCVQELSDDRPWSGDALLDELQQRRVEEDQEVPARGERGGSDHAKRSDGGLGVTENSRVIVDRDVASRSLVVLVCKSRFIIGGFNLQSSQIVKREKIG